MPHSPEGYFQTASGFGKPIEAVSPHAGHTKPLPRRKDGTKIAKSNSLSFKTPN